MMSKERGALKNICTVHQPLFIPYCGFFNKIAHSDTFVVLDNVQFRRRYFQNRNRIVHPSGEALWLTMPIVANRNTQVREVKLSTENWLPKFKRKIAHSYQKKPFFAEIWPAIEACLDLLPADLTSANILLLDRMIEIMNLKRPDIVYASQLQGDNEGRLNAIEFCGLVGGDGYIYGVGGGRAHHDPECLVATGITPLFQARVEANSDDDEDFLSALHHLLCYGPDATRKLIYKNWSIEKE